VNSQSSHSFIHSIQNFPQDFNQGLGWVFKESNPKVLIISTHDFPQDFDQGLGVGVQESIHQVLIHFHSQFSPPPQAFDQGLGSSVLRVNSQVSHP
jgi:hypothetical protein